MLGKTDRAGSIDRVEGSGHRARDTVAFVAFLERETPDFISLALWSPASLNLNPVDYGIWSVLQEKVYHSRTATKLEEIKTRLIDEWMQTQLDQSIVDAAVGQ